MEILFVTQAMPDANGAGWQRRAAQHISSLARVGRVTVLLPWAAAVDANDNAGSRCLKYGASEIMERADPPLSDFTEHRHAAARGFLAGRWHALLRVSHLDARVQPKHRGKYRQLLAQRFDAVFAFRIQSAIWTASVLGDQCPAISICDFDDLESRMLARALVEAHHHTRFWEWKLRRQLKWLKRTERVIVQTWSTTCLCSALDVERFAKIFGKKPWIVPNSYPFGEIAPERDGGFTDILFVGTFGYRPNVAGMGWFAENVWPLVRDELGEGVRLTLAGFTPPPDIVALGNLSGIRVIADAPDVAPLYANADIVIAPLFEGSGTRIKLIEAAARGRAIVTTTLGCEGLDFVDGVHAEIADTAATFAARVVALARDPARRIRLAEAALAHARERFDGEKVKRDLATRVQQLAASTSLPS